RTPFLLVCQSYNISTYSSCSFCSMTPPSSQLYTLSLHDALPISSVLSNRPGMDMSAHETLILEMNGDAGTSVEIGVKDNTQSDEDRKSTRLNSSHEWISYAVFCLKKKKMIQYQHIHESETETKAQ